MVITKGEPWGTAVPRPEGLVVLGTDADLARAVAADRATPVAVCAGDVHRTVGSPTAAADGSDVVHRVSMDLLRCELDGVTDHAAAHVVARRGRLHGWWRGPIVAVCNAQYVGTWDVAPGGHPNDGRADVIEVDPAMPVRQRFGAWRRLPSGTHVPHPSIRTSRRAEATWTFDRPLDVHVDGRRRRRVRSLRVTVEPDAYDLHL